MSRYQIIRELGRNHEGGRITYLATDTHLDSPQQVVIKEFRFAASGADWSGFKAYQREIEILRELKHPRIPHYLDSFETKSGFCLVQEYKNALPLAVRRSFTPEDIKKIAISVLEILVYLQKRTPPVIHRDIKPENILVDKELNAYLVDFGFARIRSGELALSSVAAGTPGFMPPEEQFGRPLTEASDLYSLGATIICLLTGTRSLDIGNLIDDNYRFDFKKLVPKLNRRFIYWLEKMVEPNVKQRYPNAAVALEVLQPLPIVGKASLLETIGCAIKLRMSAPVLGLLTVVTLVGLGFLIYPQVQNQQVQSNYKQAPDKALSQLIRTGSCGGCNLQNADLIDIYLESADLASADLRGANLEGSILLNANLAGADLRGANLEKTYLASGSPKPDGWGRRDPFVSLQRCLNGANLTKANLENSNLRGAFLGTSQDILLSDGCYRLVADLTEANLSRANLENADLRSVSLHNANLKDANLKNADLEYAHLENANLENANLENANLKDANLTNARLKGAIMPDGSKHP